MSRPVAVFLIFFVLALVFGAIFISNQDASKNMHRPLQHTHHTVEDYN